MLLIIGFSYLTLEGTPWALLLGEGGIGSMDYTWSVKRKINSHWPPLRDVIDIRV